MPRAKGVPRPKACSIGAQSTGRRRLGLAMSAQETLIDELRDHALSSARSCSPPGATAQYYVDAKRAMLRPAGFAALAELIAGCARVGATRWAA